MDEILANRIHRAAESILDNERLTSNLDDAAAKILLDWGLACTTRITHGNAHLDEHQAEESSYAAMRATRRLMRDVNKFVTRVETMSLDEQTNALVALVSQAEIVYGAPYSPPGNEDQRAFLVKKFDDLPQMISALRQFIENEGNE